MFSLKRGDEDVDSLIESMLRLIEYMNQNPNFKKDIFNSFTSEDLQKIVKNMEDTNISLRKVSSLFLCSILANQDNCDKFCQLLDLLPVSSKLCLNCIPDKLEKYIQYRINLLQTLNQTSPPNEQPFCWYYSLQMAREQSQNLKWVFYGQIKDIKKLFREFIDPLECIIGIVYNSCSFSKQENKIETITKSTDYYRPFTANISPEQQISNSNRFEQFNSEQNEFKKIIPFIVKTENTSPSPTINKENQQKKQHRNTPQNSYLSFLNQQKVKLESGNNNNRYVSDKSKLLKNINLGMKDKNFDLLRPRLSDNINNIQQKTKVNNSVNKEVKGRNSKQKQNTNISFNQNSTTTQNIYFRKNQNYLASQTPTERNQLNTSVGNSSSEWKSNMINFNNNNYGLNQRGGINQNLMSGNKKTSSHNNVVKVRLGEM